jgi:DNA-binding CsgD family transcriptional regulator
VIDGTIGRDRLAGHPRRLAPLPDGACPACGSLAAAGPAQAARGIALRVAIPQPVAQALVRAHALSPREHAVFQLLGLGHDNRSTARLLGVSERTVKRHVTAILMKLRLESRLQAGLAALIISCSPLGIPWPEGLIDASQNADETR